MIALSQATLSMRTPMLGIIFKKWIAIAGHRGDHRGDHGQG